MFLVNSRLSLLSAAAEAFGARPNTTEAPLLPKLRGQFAEFLNDGSLERLGAFTPVYQCRFAVRTLCTLDDEAFLGGKGSATFPVEYHRVRPPLSSSAQVLLATRARLREGTHHIQLGMRRLPVRVPPTSQTVTERGWNLDQLSIGFALRLHLRPA